MSIPTQPTSTLIVTESYKQYGISSPTAAEITRAIDYGLETIKWQIWQLGNKWRPLQSSYYHIALEGKSKYSNPTDFEIGMSCILLHGDHADTFSAITSTSSVTLAADEDATEDDVEGHLLLITSGTGINQAVQVRDYNTTTKVCTMVEAYTTLPLVTDTYMVINQEKDLEQHPMINRDKTVLFHDKGEPYYYYPYGDNTYGGFELFPVPDDTYGIQQRYYANLMRVDLTSALYSTLLRRWQGILIQGVLVWKLKQANNDMYSSEASLLLRMLADLKAKDIDNLDLSNLQITVSE